MAISIIVNVLWALITYKYLEMSNSTQGRENKTKQKKPLLFRNEGALFQVTDDDNLTTTKRSSKLRAFEIGVAISPCNKIMM